MTPFAQNFLTFLGGYPVAGAQVFSDKLLDYSIIRGKDIGPPQSPGQKILCAPSSKAPEGSEGGDYFFVGPMA